MTFPGSSGAGFQASNSTSHFIRRFVVCALSLWLTGCAQLVAFKINDHIQPRSNLQDEGELLQANHYRHCLEPGSCISYWHIQPTDEPIDYTFKLTVQTPTDDWSMTTNLSTDDQNLFQGTMLILPCYSCTKETMGWHAAYFRHLGFNVLLPDLLGHGNSSPGLGFGIKDAQLLEQIIHKHHQLPKPLLVTALSMGAYTAAHLQHQLDVDGMIWIAPSVQFDDAVSLYPQLSGSRWHRLVPEASLRKGAELALRKANISLTQTNLLDYPPLSRSLVLLSDHDLIAPYDHYLAWSELPHIDLFNLTEYPHFLMMAITPDKHEKIFSWLKQLEPLAAQTAHAGEQNESD